MFPIFKEVVPTRFASASSRKFQAEASTLTLIHLAVAVAPHARCNVAGQTSDKISASANFGETGAPAFSDVPPTHPDNYAHTAEEGCGVRYRTAEKTSFDVEDGRWKKS